MATEQKKPSAPPAVDKSTPKSFDPPHSPGGTPPLHGPEEKNVEAVKKGSPPPTLSTGEGAGVKDRDEALAKVNHDRTYSHIRAWEENEKSMSLNKYNKMVAKVNAWENTKKATAEAQLRKKEEALENKRAAYVEKMKNEIAAVHKMAEEKRAAAEAQKGEEFVKAEESAARYRASGQAPKKFLCFGA